MSVQRDPISVRTTRLNNIILGKYGGSNGAILKASVASSGRRSIGAFGGSGISDSVNREGLLDAFFVLYNECDKDTLKKRDRNILEFVNKFRPVVEETRKLRVNCEDFNVKTLIGKGYFGNVHLVVERQTGDVYAMKRIKKSVITTSQVKEERDIMSRRSSEWITNLQYAFQDTENLYLIMEYLPGGDLLGLMSRHGPFDEDLTRFYLAELTMAIHSLHSMGYVHRDIKPENILIDRFGHIKLADFGNAAALDRDGHVLSLSPVGTPDYIAPELLQTISTYKLTKSTHDVSCDYWSMGIIGYELICEITPFHEENVHETYSKILSHCEDSHLKELITFPTELKLSTHYRHLIVSLLTNPTNRLNFDGIRKHAYFDSINWDTLRAQVPPIIPSVSAEDDTSNFEDSNSRSKNRTNTFVKKSLSTHVKTNDFCGRDLPFIGYSFVHMEKQCLAEDPDVDNVRYSKLNGKLKELQGKLKERVAEINGLKQELLRAEQMSKQSESQSKILQDAKEEINRMKNIIKDKTIELAACKTQIKTLQSSIKVDEEMWEKKESTITELLRLNRQKYEEAKIASEQRYEKILADKKNELISIVQKLDAREAELTAKVEECVHINEKLENYKEMLRQFKDQAHADKAEFDKNRMHLTETYEQKLLELRTKVRHEAEAKARLMMELRDVRSELGDSVRLSKSNEEAKNATVRNNSEIMKRLNQEVENNNDLHAQKAQLVQQLSVRDKEVHELHQEVSRLERELQVVECGKNLVKSTLAASQSSPYQTAPGSLTDLRAVEEQLRADLETSKENESAQKVRADKLQEVVQRLEDMMERFNEQSLSPTKGPHPAPRQHMPSSVGDMLERQNEKLEDRLTAVREQMIVERQAARTANLALWKVEKQLEEAVTAKKMTQRRMDLTEERYKKLQAERDEVQRLCTAAEGKTKQQEERVQELKQEIAALKSDVLKEHRMWEKAEQERMKSKSEIIEHLSNVHKLEERLTEARQKLQQSQQKCDVLGLENKRLLTELSEERERSTATADVASGTQIHLKNLQDNYERLKYACTITDNQLTEVEGMLETEQKRNEKQQHKIDKLYESMRQKDDCITQLKRSLQDEEAERQAAEGRVRVLEADVEECKRNLKDVQQKLVSQQQQLIEQTNCCFAAQERIEILTQEQSNLQTLNENYEREVNVLKEENARILSELFRAKEEAHRLQLELKEAQGNAAELQADIDELQSVLTEKENYYLQRDIKSEATLAQHKKLIDYLQLKVEDLSQKKKKTLADKLFGIGSGSGNGSGNSGKENISPGAVESSILYRTLQAELRREKQRCKSLQEQIDKLQVTASSTANKNVDSRQGDYDCDDINQTTVVTSIKSPSKHSGSGKSHHRFELALQETNTGCGECLACKKPIVAGSPYWKCKECKADVHRKCRGDVSATCDRDEAKELAKTTLGDVESNADGASLGKYSYEGKLNSTDDDERCSSGAQENYIGTLVLCAEQSGVRESLEMHCAYEMEEQKLLLIGCNSALYAYHMEDGQLVHIAGIEGVKYIAVSLPLAKAIMVGAGGDSLYQCDFRQLYSRCQAKACMRPALEASVLDLPFANRGSSEKWQLVQISQRTENAIDSVAIAATGTRIVILKYDLTLQKFKPVRALDTATPVSSVLYTRHTAIVSSDKFFEIDLDTYAAEEFVDLSDQSLSHTRSCQPVVAICISRQEFLLCFMECGIFVDEFGCRSRPYDLNWEYTPTGFVYREPFLFISHFQSVQIMRLHRSYSKEVASTGNKDLDADIDDAAPILKRVYLPHYMPTLLADSGKVNVFNLAIEKDSGLQRIFHIDAVRAFRHKFAESLETISSITTSVTMGSMSTVDSL